MFSKTTHRKLILWFFSKKGNTSRQARFLGRFGTGWEVHTRSQRHNNECPWNAQCQVKNSHLFMLTKFFKIFKIVNRKRNKRKNKKKGSFIRRVWSVGHFIFLALEKAKFCCIIYRSPLGRARAWIRLALMQKKLPDYFRMLVEKRDEVLWLVANQTDFNNKTK